MTQKAKKSDGGGGPQKEGRGALEAEGATPKGREEGGTARGAEGWEGKRADAASEEEENRVEGGRWEEEERGESAKEEKEGETQRELRKTESPPW